MISTIPWELYRSFLGVLAEGSLSGAARVLGVAQPTIGRHIAALEKATGLALFTRSQTGLRPTEAALALRVYAEAMESTAAALERAAAGQGDGVCGVVRVTASEVIGIEVLPPILANLRRQYPALQVELTHSNRLQDLLHREADIAVRMTAPQQEQLIVRPVGTIELGLHARRDYLERQGAPGRVEDLSGHALIGFDRPTPFIRSLEGALPGFEREAFAFAADSDLAQLALIRAGAGIGVCQCALARRDPQLERVLPDAFVVPLQTWIAMHEDLRNSRACRAVFAALVAGLLAYSDEGDRADGENVSIV